MVNFRQIGRIVGVLLMVIGLLMFTGLPFSWYFGDEDGGYPLLKSGLICLGVGAILWSLRTGERNSVNKREGYMIVALGWLSMVFFSTIPYLFSGSVPSITDAFFETMSGMTTTGATIFTDIESLPHDILYWRSMTQWIGGMGIIVLTVAIFPLLGIGGIELFSAEAPGPTSEKIHPRIQETAKSLWLIYVGLTGILIVILKVCGMTFFDAVNHGLTTMATGGFSTKNASMAAFPSPLIQYVIILFMFLAGTNYSITYLALNRKFRKVWQNSEFKAYLVEVVFLTIFIGSMVAYINYLRAPEISFEQSFRDSLFQIVSLVTTTGFVSADYTQWSTGITMIFFILLFSGACAGSTSGGIKIIRHLVFFKNSTLEFKRLLHPNAIIPIKLSGQVVRPKVMTHITIFLLVYLFLFGFGSIILSIGGYDFQTAIGAVATSIGNVGPAIGEVGPVDNFAHLDKWTKWFLSLLMLMGRLELFTILVIMTPYFWRTN